MINPFSEKYLTDSTDERLVEEALGGSRNSLEELVLRHQAWIYNIALRMVLDPSDAEDVTQEVLVKILTKLSTFKGRSKFRTWVYRIVANHVLTMKQRKAERTFVSFDRYGEGIDRTPDLEIPDPRSLPVGLPMLLEEVRIHCMVAMLLCLSRERRLAFILGDIFGVSDAVGSEILRISRVNFRQRLSRARKLVYGFIQRKCGLVQGENACHCSRKAQALIQYGSVDPGHLALNCKYSHRVKDIVTERYHHFHDLLDEECHRLFREHPFQEPEGFIPALKRLLEKREVQEMFGLN
jgi:RNA polymerase sigma factor (sigma-70 family)